MNRPLVSSVLVALPMAAMLIYAALRASEASQPMLVAMFSAGVGAAVATYTELVDGRRLYRG